MRRGARALALALIAHACGAFGCGQILGIHELPAEGGPCVDTNSASSCGACGYACAPATQCCSGSCSTSCALTVTSVSPARGPLSGNVWVTIRGTGFATGARVWFGRARAPAMRVDAETIRALAPPNLAGAVDVRVVQGPATATRGLAFTYAAYGFKGPWLRVKMTSARNISPGMSALQDGRVLIAGGDQANGSKLATADLYDPATDTVTATAKPMAGARIAVAQVTLLDGRVLVVGDFYLGSVTPAAELYDPATDSFSPAVNGPDQPYRSFAALLADGRVLVTTSRSPSPWLFDPATNAFSAVPNAPDVTGFQPVRMLDGRVLLVTAAAPSWVWDPDASTFSKVGNGPMSPQGAAQQTPMTLPDGRVLDITANGTNAIDVFDPTRAASGFQRDPATLKEAINLPGQVMLGDGTVLVTGGATQIQQQCATHGWSLTDAVERFDPFNDRVGWFDSLPDTSAVMSGVTMPDGSVIVAGGWYCGGLPARQWAYVLKGTPP